MWLHVLVLDAPSHGGLRALRAFATPYGARHARTRRGTRYPLANISFFGARLLIRAPSLAFTTRSPSGAHVNTAPSTRGACRFMRAYARAT